MKVALPIVLALLLSPAIAALPVGPDAARAAQAEAIAAFEDGRLADAVGHYDRAYAADPQPAFLLNIALVEQQRGGRCAAALDALRRFDQICAGCAIAAQGQGTRARIEAACTGRLTVRSPDPAAVVTVDGIDRGRAPVTVELVEGAHVVRVVAADGRAVEQPVIVREGGAAEVVLGSPPALVAPPTPTPNAHPAVTMSRSDQTAGWWIAAAGVAGLGTGLGFHLAGAGTIDEVSDLDPAAPDYARDYAALGETLDAQNVGMWAGYGLGAALVGVGVWLLARDAPVEVVGAAGPTRVSVGLRF